jgi:hypothetical protein
LADQGRVCEGVQPEATRENQENTMRTRVLPAIVAALLAIGVAACEIEEGGPGDPLMDDPLLEEPGFEEPGFDDDLDQ